MRRPFYRRPESESTTLAPTNAQECRSDVPPVARIRRQGTGSFVFDDSLVPPCLQIGVSEKLMLTQRRLLDALTEKCGALARPRGLASSASGFSAERIRSWFTR